MKHLKHVHLNIVPSVCVHMSHEILYLSVSREIVFVNVKPANVFKLWK